MIELLGRRIGLAVTEVLYFHCTLVHKGGKRNCIRSHFSTTIVLLNKLVCPQRKTMPNRNSKLCGYLPIHNAHCTQSNGKNSHFPHKVHPSPQRTLVQIHSRKITTCMGIKTGVENEVSQITKSNYRQR